MTDTPACPGCDRPLSVPGGKWCQQCVLEANIMAAAPARQLTAIAALVEHVRAEEREACARLAVNAAATTTGYHTSKALARLAVRIRARNQPPPQEGTTP